MEQAGSKRRGRPPKLSRAGILVEAAQWEAEKLQLTALARHLGISAKSLYYYFPTRQSLLHALTEAAVEKIALPSLADAATWRDVLRESARWYHNLGKSHPGSFPQPSMTVSGNRVVLRVVWIVCERLVQLGWTQHDAVRAHLVVSGWAFLQGERAASEPEVLFPSGTVQKFLEDYLQPDAIEALRSALEVFQTHGDLFESGLEIILSGIERDIVEARV
jgi:AcrR family transcriptional regulator